MLVLVAETLPSKALPCVLIMIRSLAGEGNLDFASLLGSFLIVLVCFGGTWSFFLLAWSKASFGDPGRISWNDELLVTKSCFCGVWKESGGSIAAVELLFFRARS